MKPRGQKWAAVLHGAHDIRLERRPVPKLAPGMVLVRVRRVGICGSDLHYFEHGRCGNFVPSRPFVLGHEMAGEVVAAARDVKHIEPGVRVAVNPARPCGRCEYCRGGRSNLCPKTIMLGSASTRPPTDGAFAEYVAVRASQCHRLPDKISDGAGAMMEPLAVALHAVKRCGSPRGKRVLITGGGPIGLLVAAVARSQGATFIALSDPVAERQKAARGADVGTLFPGKRERDFDIVFEASGAHAALRQALELARRGGTIIQIGTLHAGDIALPAFQIMSRELQWLGSFRYVDLLDEAIELALSGRVKLEPLISSVFPLQEISRALAHALDKRAVIKVQLEVAGG